MPISWNTVIIEFRLIFATDERIAFHYNALGNPVEPCFFCWHGSMSFPKTQQWQAIPNIILHRSKNQAKFENDCVLTNGHRIKITQSNLMILVSFSSAEDVWFNDVNRYNSSQGTENPPFHFFWDTRYMKILFLLYANIYIQSLKNCPQLVTILTSALWWLLDFQKLYLPYSSPDCVQTFTNLSSN